MLKPVFYIAQEELDTLDYSQCRLLMEVNANSFSYVVLNLKGMRPVALGYFHWNQFKKEALDDMLRDILGQSSMLNGLPGESFIVYNFPESVLVPERFFNGACNKELTDAQFGDLDQNLVLDEKIPWWEYHNVYRIPAEAHRLLQGRFATSRYWHFYSLQLKCHKMFTAKEVAQFCKVIFYPDKIVVLVFITGRLQLVQTFSYQDAKDIAYHLINCFRQLGLSREEAQVELSGLIEQDSTLYAELQKYFLNLGFESVEDNLMLTDELKEYPIHYFSSLLKMAVCV